MLHHTPIPFLRKHALHIRKSRSHTRCKQVSLGHLSDANECY